MKKEVDTIFFGVIYKNEWCKFLSKKERNNAKKSQIILWKW